MTFEPLKDFVLLEIEVQPEKIGMIYTPDTSRRETNIGRIAAKGTETSDDFSVGDRVLYDHLAGVVVSQEGGIFKLLKEETIFALVKEA